MQLWCLSNDVSEWSKKLRGRFGLEGYFQGFVISGDVGACKPAPAMYQCLLDQAGIQPGDAVFVDDRLRNVKAAEAMGIPAILFKPAPQDAQGHAYRLARTFAELLSFLP